MSEPSGDVWLHCSACRRDIPFGAIHWVCSVSTCNRARMQLVFCSVSCWDSHVATLRHRDAWAVEERAPSRAAWLVARTDAAAISAPTHRTEAPTAPLRQTLNSALPRVAAPPPVFSPPPAAPSSHAIHGPLTLSSAYERDMLIVVSKLKKYIRDRSGMNTSDSVADALGEHVRAICDQAIHAAATDGRKTVLDRDVPPLRR